MFSGKLEKYRGLLIAVTSLVVFFLVYLLISQVLQKQALKSVKYAGVVSAITKNLDTTEAGDATLSANFSAMNNGGTIAGNKYESLNKFLAPEKPPIGQLVSAYASGDVTKARSTMATINELVNEKTDKRIALTSTLQLVAAILTVLLYALVVLPMFFRIKESDDTAVSSQKETEGIMGTVSEGLFLLSEDHEIGVEQSASLKGMFKLERDLEGNFFDFILQYVTQDAVNIAKDYIELLFGDRVKERLVEDLNPLKQVEINIIRRDGSYENRYLDFKFKRVLVDGQLSHLLGSVTDVTKQVILEQQLIESKEEQEAQIDLLMSILHVDNRQLKSFFETTETALNNINEILESRGYDDAQIRTKLRDISRDVHRIKGDAAALNLNNFEFAAHALEDEIETVQKDNKKLSGKLLLPVTTKLRDLFAELERMKSLMVKFSDAMQGSALAPSLDGLEQGGTQAAEQKQQNMAHIEDKIEAMSGLSVDVEAYSEAIESDIEPAAVPDVTLHDNLERLAQTVGKRNGVDVNFQSSGLNGNEIPEHLKESINSTLVQLVRNSIVHGGQTAHDRASQGKSAELNIQAQFKKKDDQYQLIVKDDGNGIDSEKIIAKAFEKKLITQEQSEKFGPREAMTLIFSPGFSSKNKADLDGGRGVGLDVVFEQTKQHNGKISVKSGKGLFCKFLFTYPAN